MRKIQDTFSDNRSAFDVEWTERKIKKLFRSWRSSAPVPKGKYNNGELVPTVQKTFGLRGVQFGNWLNNEDRYNYILAAYAAFYDMNKVLRFKTNNMGLSNTLVLSFGARGIPNSLAHYEGDNDIINLTRYIRQDDLATKRSKEWRFIHTGGAGSFAHEYGHFLDNAFGRYSDQSKGSNWLTGNPRSVSKGRLEYNKRQNPIRYAMEDVFEKMLWNNGKPTKFQKRITQQTEYYNRRCEIFARLFEVYIAYKLEQMGISNYFLTKRKYNIPVYLTDSEMKRVMPEMDFLISLMRERS